MTRDGASDAGMGVWISLDIPANMWQGGRHQDGLDTHAQSRSSVSRQPYLEG